MILTSGKAYIAIYAGGDRCKGIPSLKANNGLRCQNKNEYATTRNHYSHIRTANAI